MTNRITDLRDTEINLNPLGNYVPEDDNEDSISRCPSGREIVIGTGSTLAAASSVGVRYLSSTRWHSPYLNYLMPIITGIFTQISFQNFCPRKWARPINQFNIDYSLVTFLLLTQIYLNLDQFPGPVDPAAGEAILGVMLALGGTWTAIKATMIFGRTVADEENLPYEVVDDDSPSPTKQPPNYLEWSYYALQGLTGITCITSGNTIPRGIPFATEIGTVLLGDLAGQAIEKFLHELEKRCPGQKSVWKAARKTGEIVGRNSYGMLFVANHPAAYLAIGILGGVSSAAANRRFAAVNLTAVDPFHPLSTAEKVGKVAKYTMSAAFAGGMLYVMFSNTPSIDNDTKFVAECFTPAVFASFLATRGLSYFVRGSRKPNRLKDLAYYLVHFRPEWLAFPYLLINQKMKIGDDALTNADPATKTAAALAWLSLGGTLGNELAKESSAVTGSPAADALFWNFVIGSIKQQS